MIFLDLLFCNAQKKLNALTDARHSDEEIEHRLAEIDEEIRKVKDFLAPQSLLPWPAPSVTAITHLPVPHRLHPPHYRHTHRADDCTVPVEALVGGAPPSPLGDAYL